MRSYTTVAVPDDSRVECRRNSIGDVEISWFGYQERSGQLIVIRMSPVKAERLMSAIRSVVHDHVEPKPVKTSR